MALTALPPIASPHLRPSGVCATARRHVRVFSGCVSARQARSSQICCTSSTAPQGDAAASLYAEETASGQRYLEAVITGFEPSTGVLSLLCTARCAALPPQSREFPLLLDAAAAAAVSAALQAHGLPPSLAALQDLHTKDVRLLYVNSLDAPTPGSGTLFIYDLVTETKSRVDASFDEVLSMCIRFQQPVLVHRNAILKANGAALAKRVQSMPGGAADAPTVASLAEAFGKARDAHTDDAQLPAMLAALGALYPSRPAGSAA
jgi:hypothetical protein